MSRCPASSCAKSAPKTATPIEPPTCRNSVDPDDATPYWVFSVRDAPGLLAALKD